MQPLLQKAMGVDAHATRVKIPSTKMRKVQRMVAIATTIICSTSILVAVYFVYTYIYKY
ncbi:MAG: hypothetical protein ACOYKE_07635 [Ferruginibacter sp.]